MNVSFILVSKGLLQSILFLRTNFVVRKPTLHTYNPPLSFVQKGQFVVHVISLFNKQVTALNTVMSESGSLRVCARQCICIYM